MEVQVPEAVHVGHLVRTGLARSERLAAGLLAMAALARPQQPLLFHVSGERRIARDRPEAGVLSREREQVVVMELKAPARMVPVLAGERDADARVRAGMPVDPAREGSEWVFGVAGDIPPPLDGLEREVGRAPGGRVPPRSRGELLDAAFELTRVGGSREQRTHDLKAQTGPSHARTGRVVGIGHWLRAEDKGLGATATTLREREKARVPPSSARARGRAIGHTRPRSKRDASGVLAVVIGASHASSLVMRTAGSPTNRSRIEVGNALREKDGTSRADSSTNAALVVNGPRHQRRQRRVVRAATPVVRSAAAALAAARATTLARITTAPTYTRRPRKRNDGGMARRRQPSRPQHRLKRRPSPSPATPSSPPRGLRGWSLRYNGPPHSRQGSSESPRLLRRPNYMSPATMAGVL